MSYRLVAIDQSNRADHYYLTEEDACYCLGEYQAGAGYRASPLNSLILNFKKSVSKRGLSEYQHKEAAIIRVGHLLGQLLPVATRASWTIVPVPPSKMRSDPQYDDRLCSAIRAAGPDIDLRELIVLKESVRAHHEFSAGEKRPTPDQLYARLRIDETLLSPPVRSRIILFDDVLTTGTHFKACKRLLLEHLPASEVIGIFIGRTVRPASEDFESLFD